MKYKYCYQTNTTLGNIFLYSNGEKLTGLSFNNEDGIEIDLPIFNEVKQWLDAYFKGKITKPFKNYQFDGLSNFEAMVLEEVSQINYGDTSTYGLIAFRIAKKLGLKKMSPQAIGRSLKHNPILIIIPCHRIIGANRELVGYCAGLEKKKFLLEMERLNKKEQIK